MLGIGDARFDVVGRLGWLFLRRGRGRIDAELLNLLSLLSKVPGSVWVRISQMVVANKRMPIHGGMYQSNLALTTS